MKKFSVWFFSLIVLFYSFASAVPVKASSPSFNVDYSNLLTASQISAVMSGLSASGLSALYNSLGGLGYAYLQSVNVDVKSSSPSSVLSDLGEMIYNFIVNPLPNQIAGAAAKYLYDVLSPQTKYLVSTMVKDSSSGSLNESNYNTFKYEWKTQVSEPMSDIFNTYGRLFSFSINSDSFCSASSSAASELWSLSSSDILNLPSDDFYFQLHSDFPTGVRGFGSSISPLTCLSYTVNFTYGFDFDTVIFFDSFDFSDSSSHSIYLDNSSLFTFSPSEVFPMIFYNSVNNSVCLVPKLSNNSFIFGFLSNNPMIYKESTSYFYYDYSYMTSSSNYIDTSSPYVLSDFANYFLSLSSSRPSCLSSYNGTTLTNVNALVISPDSRSNYDLSSASPYSTVPVSIDPSQSYQGSLQIPIDNAPDSTATLDIQSVIDAINDNSLVNNIDRLGDIISDGIVGSIPTYSVDAWSPDVANEYVHVSDLSLGLEGVQSLEGTFTDNVQPVFDSFPLFPFIAPIWNTFQQYPVIGLITACIFLVVLFGFLNKLLF